MDALDLSDEPGTPAEELANALSHGLGLLLAIAALPVLVLARLQDGDWIDLIADVVFAVTMILLYLASTVYHALPRFRHRDILQVLDHSAIYLLIAGTYTPFTLGVLRGPVGWTLFGIIWALAIAGVVKKSIIGPRYPRLSLLLYILMGWLVVFAIIPLWNGMSLWGLFWLFGGGVLYTSGTLFFSSDHLPFRHLVWHLFVLAGSISHFVAVLYYAHPVR